MLLCHYRYVYVLVINKSIIALLDCSNTISETIIVLIYFTLRDLITIVNENKYLFIKHKKTENLPLELFRNVVSPLYSLIISIISHFNEDNIVIETSAER